MKGNKATEVESPVAQATKHSNHSTIDAELKAALENAMIQGTLSDREADEIIHCQSLNDWLDPLPLICSIAHLTYPITALPPGIRKAVQQVTDFVQCPPSLAACSALATLSVAGQGLANIRRSEHLTGPISLFLLAIADSGERKTTCDHHFSVPIRKWEAQQAKTMQSEMIKYDASIKSWHAKEEGIIAEIKRLSKSNKPSANLEFELEKLEGQKPSLPRIPRLLYGDSTPEALAWTLSSGWHSGGVLSSEAGIVFGSHGMNKESAMRNLALLNVLWDGGILKIDRRTNGSFTLQGARLTMGLAVQPDAIRLFFDSSNGLARSIGFAARFLIAWPKSTQGERFFKHAPANWEYLSTFHNRIESLLNLPLNFNEKGEIEPITLDLSADAKSIWIAFHDDVERELKPGGDMVDARDVASKAADNAARLAALFHLYEIGLNGTINEDFMKRAACIVGWHLYESRHFLNEIALPTPLLNASKLNDWLMGYCRKNRTHFISTRDLQRLGPGSLRKKEILDNAIEILIESERIRRIEEERHKVIYINPKLLEGSI